ncbi:hypothetical protein BX666DRAFT_1034306 [Dichotomocladium elegans]|nr:hypothetical protein BX666DRAFT_1034306 [Dichotomocladium elegans]
MVLCTSSEYFPYCCHSFILLVGCLLLFRPDVLVDGAKHRTKVVILGAGAAGISAAAKLHEKGEEDFMIVDAQAFIGGRVQNAAFANTSVELGANWIYGKGMNPVYRLASKYGLNTAPSDKKNVVYFDDHGSVHKSVGDRVYATFESVMKEAVFYAEKRMAHDQVDLSSRAALQILGWDADTPLKAAIEYFAIDWELAEPAEISSLDYATGTSDMTEGTFPYGNEFVVDKRGFNHILQMEAAQWLDPNDQRLLLDTLVTHVYYHDTNVTVITRDGHEIVADYAICTFSLGVLQSNSVKFIPPFPEWKREALYNFHMTTYTKIFMHFNCKFWDDWQFALYAHNGTTKYTVWQNLNAPGYLEDAQENILMVTATYKEAERIERLSDTQVVEEIMKVLKRMFPHKHVPYPSAILVPRWHSNPLFRGSYSNWPIGMSVQHHQNIRAPLIGGELNNSTDRKNPTLWFAGEAMSAEYYGFLHGAWIEGASTADKILKCMDGICPSYVFHEYVRACSSTSPPIHFRIQLK